LSLLAIGLLSFVDVTPAPAVGPYVDAARISAFVRAPQRPAVIGLVNHSEAAYHGASYFWLAGDIPIKSKFLLQLEIPYIDLAYDEELRDGFGDIRLRAKSRAWTWTGAAVFLLGGIGFGSGTADLFPYSTQSTDWEVGVAFVDTLGARDDNGLPTPLTSLTFWVSTSAVYVTRLPERLKDTDLHDNYATLSGGLVYPLSRWFDIEAGGLGLRNRSGVTREIYYSQLMYHHTRATMLFATVQGERADWRERASEYSVVIGMSVNF
jgi:hypothetical protein